MELRDLVDALLRGDTLEARQWVVDAARVGLSWSDLPSPEGLSPVGLAVAAGVVETMASRAGQPAPSWALTVPASPTRVFLVRAAETMPRLRRLCEEEG
ncbi:MAG: hypothetical protein ACRD1Z_08265, partial [Vicinamibacteria bacterium]